MLKQIVKGVIFKAPRAHSFVKYDGGLGLFSGSLMDAVEPRRAKYTRGSPDISVEKEAVGGKLKIKC